MTTSCRDFRTLLELVLEGRAVERALSELAWHEHLLSCGACRNLLEAEEALEILLATLPEPKLPEHLARRVVSRLRAARKESRLDALLDLDRAARAPDRLAASVLARLQPERERSAESAAASAELRLERLLDLERDVAVPEGLAQRVLTSLRAERTLARQSTVASAAGVRSFTRESTGAFARESTEAFTRQSTETADAVAVRSLAAGRGAQRFGSRWLYAAAAGALATLAGWAAWQHALGTAREGAHDIAQDGRSNASIDASSPEKRSTSPGAKLARLGNADKVAQRDASAVPEAGMLAALDVLEQWDLLKSDDVDVLISSTIDAADEVLLEYQDAEPAAPPFKEKEPEPRSKG